MAQEKAKDFTWPQHYKDQEGTVYYFVAKKPSPSDEIEKLSPPGQEDEDEDLDSDLEAEPQLVAAFEHLLPGLTPGQPAKEGQAERDLGFFRRLGRGVRGIPAKVWVENCTDKRVWVEVRGSEPLLLPAEWTSPTVTATGGSLGGMKCEKYEFCINKELGPGARREFNLIKASPKAALVSVFTGGPTQKGREMLVGNTAVMLGEDGYFYEDNGSADVFKHPPP